MSAIKQIPEWDDWNPRLSWDKGGRDSWKARATRLSPGKQEQMRIHFKVGLEGPKHLKREVFQTDYPDQEEILRKQIEDRNDAESDEPAPMLMAWIKDLVKLVKLGALSWPRAGRYPIVLPIFSVVQPDKVRVVHDFSRQPLWNSNTDIRSPADDFSPNSGCLNQEKTCSFPAALDKAAMTICFGGGGTYDLSGWYSQEKAHESLSKYQGIIIPLGHKGARTAEMRGVMFGFANAPAHAHGGNYLIHETLGKTFPEIFKTSNYPTHTELGFNQEREKDWKGVLARIEGKKGIFFELRKGCIKTKKKKWLTAVKGQPLDAWIVHIDDSTIVTDSSAAMKILEEAGIVLSKKGDPMGTVVISAGIKMDFAAKTLSIPDPKWEDFEQRVRIFCDNETTTLERLAKIVGVIAYMSSLWFQLRLFASYLGKFVSALSEYPKARSAAHWRRIKKRVVKIPLKIRNMTEEAWSFAKEHPNVPAANIIAAFTTPDVVIATDASGNDEVKGTWAGLGAVNMTTMKVFAFQVQKHPQDHPWFHNMLSKLPIAQLEALTLLFALMTLVEDFMLIPKSNGIPWILHFMQDNSNVKAAAKKQKAGELLWPLAVLMQRWMAKYNVVVQCDYVKSDIIIADSPSRFFKDEAIASAEFAKRFKILKQMGITKAKPKKLRDCIHKFDFVKAEQVLREWIELAESRKFSPSTLPWSMGGELNTPGFLRGGHRG